ncbi:MAG: zinc metallopeptidase [Clostridia bacterium]|nr:zinc metallopeptidase [Clostridia bacterium]
MFYILAIGVYIVSMIIQARLQSTFNKYSKVRTTARYSADEAAEIILRDAEVRGLTIQPIQGSLTDNYNPRKHTINLSQSVYGSYSIAAIAVAAHECGHAIQDSKNWWFYRIRQFLAPIAGIASRGGVYIAMLGILIMAGGSYAEAAGSYELGYNIITIGIVAYFVAFLFYLIMVPVEYDASNRALKIIKEMGLVGEDQVKDCKKVLRAAGRTYVVAMASAGVTLLRLFLIRGNRRR